MRSWLVAIRESKNLSQKSVANLVGITQPTYCNLENDNRSPSVQVAKKIGAVLGFDWTRFYEEGE